MSRIAGICSVCCLFKSLHTDGLCFECREVAVAVRNKSFATPGESGPTRPNPILYSNRTTKTTLGEELSQLKIAVWKLLDAIEDGEDTTPGLQETAKLVQWYRIIPTTKDIPG